MRDGKVSYCTRAAATVAACIALSGCSLFAINDSLQSADWQLQKSTADKVLKCVEGSIDVCASTRKANPLADVEITPDVRLTELRALRANKAITSASIQKGHVVLALLGKGAVPTSLGTAEIRTQAYSLSTYLSPETQSALVELVPDSIAIAQMSPERLSPSWVLGAQQAEQALSVNDACVELDRIRYNTTGARSAAGSFSVGKRSFRECLQYTRDATGLDGWPALSAHYFSILAVESARAKAKGGALSDADKRTLAVLLHEAVTAGLVGAYMKAYFNGGQIFAVDLDVKKLAEATKTIKTKLGIDDATAKKLVDNLLQQIIGTKPDGDVYHLLVKKTDGGFVTRAGATYAFPGITVTIDPKSNTPVALSKIDLAEVGGDMMRVLIEGLGDGWAMIPGDPKATGVTQKLLSRYAPPAGGEPGVCEEQFTKVNDWANRAEGIVGSATAQAIRGISWISLNNEALAKMIETAVGVAARKGTEKLAWCVYACSPKVCASTEVLGDLTVNPATLKLDK